MKTHRLSTWVKYTLCSALAFLNYNLHAQTYTAGKESYMSWEEFADLYFNHTDPNTSEQNEDVHSTFERLEELHRQPININTANRDDLLKLPFLSEAQTDSILSYRKKKRLLLTLGELQWISNLPFDVRRQLSLFVYAGDTLRYQTSIWEKFKDGNYRLTTHLDIPLYRRAGYRDTKATNKKKTANSQYLGNSLAHTLRFRYRWHQDLSYGFTLQKDAGEPFGKYNNYPYDYISFYLYYRPEHRCQQWWVGDFNASWGNGLLMGNSFFNSQFYTIYNIPRQANRIRPHSSADEYRFFRGIAASFLINDKWGISAFLSLRQMDGRVRNDSVVTLPSNGFHRTRTEMARKNRFLNFVSGSRISYNDFYGHIGLNFYWSLYDKTIYPAVRKYNRYVLRGKSAAGISTDYAWRNDRWNIQGEMAFDRNLHWAVSSLIRYHLNDKGELTFQQRSFSDRFVSPFGKTLQGGSRIQNEHGALLGISIRPFHHIGFISYIDYAFHPSATFRADRHSHRFEYLLQTDYTASRKNRWSLSYKLKGKQENVTGHKGIQQFVYTHRIRLKNNLQTSEFSITNAADFTTVCRQTSQPTFGWMISSRCRYNFAKQWSAQAFAAVFFSDDFAARLFAYEPQLPFAANFPSFSNHGFRLAGITQWNFCTKGSAALRYSLSHYFNKHTISSGPQLIDSSSQNDLEVYVSWKF